MNAHQVRGPCEKAQLVNVQQVSASQTPTCQLTAFAGYQIPNLRASTSRDAQKANLKTVASVVMAFFPAER